jgi:membrane-bound serine protease (ClpP class)
MGSVVLAVMVLIAAQVRHAHAERAEPGPKSAPAVVIALQGQVDDYTRDTLMRRVEEARRLGAKTILLKIDTYGGLVTAGLEISHFLKSQPDLHIIAVVDDKAISAGAMIALACDEIVMTPGAKIGDCAPIMVSTEGEDQKLVPLPPAERAKMESPILADFYDSAIRNHHDPLLAQAMVAVDRSVYVVEKEGARRFVEEKEYAVLKDAGWSDVVGVPAPLDGPTTLLTLYSDVAEKVGLSKGTVGSMDELAAQRNYAIVATLIPSAGERVIETLGGSVARGLLITLFLVSLYAAFHIPGHGLPEAVVVMSLAVLLGVPLLTGYAQWWEIAAILVGLGLIAFEIFVFPGHGVSGVLGAVMVVGGLIMTFVGKEPAGTPGLLPSLQMTWNSLQTGMIVVVAGLACSGLLCMWLRAFLPKLPYVSRLILTATSGETAATGGAETMGHGADTWPFVGTVGRAVTDLRPGGSAQFAAGDDVRITAVVSEAGYVTEGTRVEVREVAGNRVVVRPV